MGRDHALLHPRYDPLSQATGALRRARPDVPDPFRQLGVLHYQQKETDKARDAFKKYLALKPDAPDARRIKEYLVELDR